ncbi:MAG: hypothetical protein IAE89_07760 [Anaerolineae bacterium]|nr:hypothetical protein [Anaerolineae bacterium]
MRRFTLFSILVLCGLLFGVASSALAQGGLDTITTANANLRSGPGTEWRTITVVIAGSPFRLDGRAPGDYWLRGITPAGEIGFVAIDVLNVTPEQIAGLPEVWVETPFTLPPPEGGAVPVAATPVPGQAEVVVVSPVTSTSPVRGFSYGGHVADFSQFASDAMHRAGMTWVKRQWRFHPGQNPAEVAGMINDAHARGFRILLGIVGEPGSVLQPGYFDQYAAFVGGVAAQGADAIEVWNEMNIDREWPSGSINPALYTQLLAQSYNAIKASNPNTMVISGAPAPTGYFQGCGGGGCDDNYYVQGMAAAGAASYMDCIGVHYNEGIVPPSQTSGDPRGNSSHYTRYYSGMVNTYYRAFGGARPLCFTELGYLSPEGFGPLPGGFEWAGGTDVGEQAAWLDQAVSMAAQSGRVRLLIVWNVDFAGYGADPQAGYAMIRPGGACPACDALGS